MARPRETAKTKLIRLVFLVVNVLTLLLGMGLGYVGWTQSVDPAAQPANTTSDSSNATLLGAEAIAAPYSKMSVAAVVTMLASVVGIVGACRTDKHRDRRRGVLLLYHATLLLAASASIWLAIMCLFFVITNANQADVYVDRYWRYIQSAFPDNISETEAIELIDSHLRSAAVLGVVVGVLLIVGLYCSAHLVGHRYLTRSMLMWMNGLSIMGGAVLATSGLVVANENLGGDYFAYLVSALGGFAVFAGVLGTHGARGENGWTLLLFVLLMLAVIIGLGCCGLYLMFNARPDWIKEHWEIVETKIYPLSYDEAVDLAAAHFTELGASATIVAALLLVNACSACYLRRRIQREGRFFEPLESDLHDDDSAWEEETDHGRGKAKAP